MKLHGMFLPVFLLVLLAACQNPLNDSGDQAAALEPGTGSIEFRFATGVEQTIAPPIELRREYYRVIGDGPGDNSFNERVAAGTAAFPVTVVVGEWRVTVEAYNSDDGLVGRGTDTITVGEGATARASVTIRPISDDNGTLSATVGWTGGGNPSLALTGTLDGINGPDSNLSESAQGSPITVSGSAAPGTYVLAVRLRQGGRRWPGSPRCSGSSPARGPLSPRA